MNNFSWIALNLHVDTHYEIFFQQPNENLHHHSGRPHALSEREERRLVRNSKRNPFLTAPELKTGNDINASVSTVRRVLVANGLHGRVAAKKELLTDRHKNQRLEFCRENNNKTMAYWNSVVFTDEKHWCNTDTNQKWVRRPIGQRFEPQYVTGKRTSGRIGLNVWGWIGCGGPGQLIRLDSDEGRFNSDLYLDILIRDFMPSVTALYGNEFVFQVNHNLFFK